MTEAKIKEHRINKEVFNITASWVDIDNEASYKMMLHTGEYDLYIDQIVSVHITRDYNNAYCDYIEVDFAMPLGDFIYAVLPAKDKLQVTLTNYVVGGVNRERLNLVLKDVDPDVLAKKYHNSTHEELNRKMTQASGQCVNVTIESMRTKLTSGIYKDTTVEDVVRTVFFKELNIMSSLYGLTPGGLKMVPSNNKRKYEHITIPEGTTVLGVPTYLQKGDYGIYNGHISTYLQTYDSKEIMYIAPLYRQNLFSYFDKKLYIVGVASIMMANVENTYAVSDDMIKILVPTNNAIAENDYKIRDHGTAIETTESDAILSRPAQITKDKMKVNSDYVIEKQAHKKISNGIGPVKNKGVKNNQYDARSDALIRDGIVAQLKWNNSNSRLLTPLMPVVYIYEADGKILKHEGILQRVDTITDNSARAEGSVLTVFLNKGSNNSPLGKVSGGMSMMKDMF